MNNLSLIKNTQGKVFYGLHFYPGVAQYVEPGTKPLMVFLNEQTIRSMDSGFAGRPVFVHHVDEVNPSIDHLREEADGWVVESFFNRADGKHWVKFILVSEKGMQAVQSGMRLSNAYIAKTYAEGGMWNGINYDKEIIGAEYDHLAIVPNPRYEESVIMTPEEFKNYNDSQQQELIRIANSKTKGETKMKGLSFFKKEKVTNSDLNLESISVQLPTSKKEMTINELVEQMDKIENAHGYCNMEHLVKVGNDEMSVGDLVKKHMDAMADMEKSKKAHDEEGSDMDNDEEESSTVESGVKDVDSRGGDKSLDNDESDEEKEAKEEKLEKKQNAIEKAKRLHNANNSNVQREQEVIMTSSDRVALGKSLFGRD